ncbi:MAG: molybdenum ABC transporter ATP-binding protein [Thiolinea sp.]
MTADHNVKHSDSGTISFRFQLSYSGFRLNAEQQLPGQGVTVLFGPSGCGKSTLLRCIAGLERADSSFLCVKGEVWDDSSQGLFRPVWQRPIGYVFQEASLFPHLTVQQNLEFGRKRSRLIRDPENLQQTIELLGIAHLLQRMPERLSGGERQRVAIARALAVCPQLLLMDEPLAALDLQRKQEILPFLTRLHNELDIPVLYVTHSPQEVTRLADHIVLLNDGTVAAAGALETVLTRLDSPLADSKQASTVLKTVVVGYEPDYQMMQVEFAGGRLSLPYREQQPPGTKMRLRIYARDVSLALLAPEQSSISNILPARIAGMTAGEPGLMITQLKIGGSLLLAHVSCRSVARLGLATGMPVFAQVKAAAIV